MKKNKNARKQLKQMKLAKFNNIISSSELSSVNPSKGISSNNHLVTSSNPSTSLIYSGNTSFSNTSPELKVFNPRYYKDHEGFNGKVHSNSNDKSSYDFSISSVGKSKSITNNPSLFEVSDSTYKNKNKNYVRPRFFGNLLSFLSTSSDLSSSMTNDMNYSHNISVIKEEPDEYLYEESIEKRIPEDFNILSEKDSLYNNDDIDDNFDNEGSLSDSKNSKEINKNYINEVKTNNNKKSNVDDLISDAKTNNKNNKDNNFINEKKITINNPISIINKEINKMDGETNSKCKNIIDLETNLNPSSKNDYMKNLNKNYDNNSKKNISLILKHSIKDSNYENNKNETDKENESASKFNLMENNLLKEENFLNEKEKKNKEKNILNNNLNKSKIKYNNKNTNNNITTSNNKFKSIDNNNNKITNKNMAISNSIRKDNLRNHQIMDYSKANTNLYGDIIKTSTNSIVKKNKVVKVLVKGWFRIMEGFSSFNPYNVKLSEDSISHKNN